MLLQSQSGEIEFLPALPAAWPNGFIRGLCARGGYVVDIAWQNSKLLAASVRSLRGGSTPVRYGDKVITISLQPGETIRLRRHSFEQPNITSAATAAGR
jgi:alpha-L-fucosidase 2